MATRTRGGGDAGPRSDKDARVAGLEAENALLRARIAELERNEPESDLGARMRHVGDVLPVLVSYVDAEGRYLYNNKTYEAWFGRNRREMWGRHMREVLGEAAYEQLRPHIARALAGKRVSVDSEIPYRDGGTRFVHIEYVPDKRADGSVSGFYALVQDMSERHRAEQEVRESEARFRAMADSAPAPVWVTGPEGLEFVNKALIEYVGIPGDRFTGDAWTQAIHPDHLADVVALRDRGWQDAKPYQYVGRFRRHDGEWRWVHVSSNPRIDETGRLLGFVGMAIDIHEERKAETELRESEERFRTLADSAPALILVNNLL
ncbi:MAG: PAS domain-containing protein, partial [Sphingosinicella sp.]